jgi:Zn-dependent peptidase ImmA (M78 family)
MHHNHTKFRGAGAVGPTAIARAKGYESAEHQAKVFAAAFLIHEEDAGAMHSAEEISVEFGVSKQAADIFF